MRWVILHHGTSSLPPEKSAGACEDISQTERGSLRRVKMLLMSLPSRVLGQYTFALDQHTLAGTLGAGMGVSINSFLA